MRRFRVFRENRTFFWVKQVEWISERISTRVSLRACCSAQRLAWRSGYSAAALAIGTARNKTTRQSHPSAHLMGQGRVRGVRGRRRLSISSTTRMRRWSAELLVRKTHRLWVTVYDDASKRIGKRSTEFEILTARRANCGFLADAAPSKNAGASMDDPFDHSRSIFHRIIRTERVRSPFDPCAFKCVIACAAVITGEATKSCQRCIQP